GARVAGGVRDEVEVAPSEHHPREATGGRVDGREVERRPRGGGVEGGLRVVARDDRVVVLPGGAVVFGHRRREVGVTPVEGATDVADPHHALGGERGPARARERALRVVADLVVGRAGGAVHVDDVAPVEDRTEEPLLELGEAGQVALAPAGRVVDLVCAHPAARARGAAARSALAGRSTLAAGATLARRSTLGAGVRRAAAGARASTGSGRP